MSTLFSDPIPGQISVPVVSFAYPDIGSPFSGIADAAAAPAKQAEPVAPAGPSPAEINALVERARAEAIAQTEQRMTAEAEARAQKQAVQIKDALREFAEERNRYFSQVESEVVRLALAIAGRILHREAQVDPLLIAALVRVAVEKLEVRSGVSVRVSPQEIGRWRPYFADLCERMNLALLEDPQLEPGDCVLETEMGSTEMGVDAQLKEVEKGFFDLLAQRPHIS